MTEVQRAIILVCMIGTILEEYKEDELTPAIKELRDVCQRFMDKQSGVEMTMQIDWRKKRVMRPRITNKKRHDQFLATVRISDRIWQGSLDRYASKGINIDATATVMALYSFAPDILHKHARISQQRIEAYRSEGNDGDEKLKSAGSVIGGYLTELLAKEMGMKINGRLRALKHKIEMKKEAA
jgi:hypothetical protein